MEIDDTIIVNINREVEKRFPYLRNISPEIQPQGGENSLLVYKGKVATENGHEMPLNVRVVIDSTGKILKMTASR